jgi:transcriptional regulator with XRE-family HTH domain
VADETDAQRRLARAIQEAMDAAKLTPPKLAAKLGVAPKTVNRWVNGEAVPSALSIRPLADALGVSPMLFVDPPPVPEYPLEEYLVRRTGSEAIEEGLRRARGSAPQRRAS